MNRAAGIEGTAFTRKPMRIVALGLCLLALSCTRRAGPMDGTDSTSHWLLECSTDGECGDAESCLCGVCTRECTESSDCTDFAADAECRSPTVCGGVSACLLACTGDRDCPSAASTCVDERCVNVGATGGSGGQGPGESGGSGGAPTSGGAPAGGTTSSLSEADALAAIPAGCEFLAARGDGECVANIPCEVAAQEPDVSRGFRFLLPKWSPDGELRLTDAELLANATCLSGWLEALGLVSETELYVVSTEGTWSLLQHVTKSAAIEAYDIDCNTGCCYGLSQAQCEEDPACYALHGNPIDVERECVGPSTFSMCIPAGTECTTAFTPASDLDGVCLEYSSGCYVPYLQHDQLGDPVCPSSADRPSCADVSDCFSPTTNQDRVGEPGFPGCACEAGSAGYCTRTASLICDEGFWRDVIDGPCFEQGLCDRLVPDATTCGQGFWTCIELEDGTYCAIEPRDGSYAELSPEQCASVGGEVAELGCPEPSFGRLRATVDGASCCTPNAGQLTVDECESLGGTAVADPGDNSLIACPDDGDLVALVRPGDVTNHGLCCF